MDVKFLGRFVRLGGAVLAWAAVSGPVAAEDGSSVAFVMATDDEYAVAEDAPPAEPSELVIHIADDAPRAIATDPVAAPRAVAGRGDLTVVAKADRPASASVVIADSAVMPAASVEPVRRRGGLNWGSVLGVGPRRPSSSAGIQGSTRQAPTTQQAARAAAEPLDEPPAAYEVIPPSAMPATVTAPKIKSPADHAKEQLVQAYQLSLSASNEGEFSQIIQWCASASRVELDVESAQFGASMSAWALNRRGQVRADEGQSELALADFRAALEFDPASWRALHNRAVTSAQSGQFAEAFDDLCRVVQLNPKHAKAYSNRATLYVQAGDFEKALDDYDAALAVDPKLLPALVGRGRVCHMQGRLDDALENLTTAVQCAPKDAEIVCSRADLLADLGRYEDALADYATAIDLNAKFEHAYRNGAWLLATCPEDEVRDAEGAIVGAQAALECGYGERHAALDTLAAAYANAERWDEALLSVRQAIEIAPAEFRAAYEARQQLYELRKPFRTRPVGEEAEAGEAEFAGYDEEAAVYVEE